MLGGVLEIIPNSLGVLGVLAVPRFSMKRLYDLLMQSCGIAAALTIGMMALLVTVDVIARNSGLGSFPWVVEISEYSLPVATFLAAPWLLYRNEHVRLDLLVTSLPKKLAQQIDRLADLIGIAVCVVFFWYGVRVIADSAKLGSMVIKTLVFPEWWLFVPVPLSFGLLAVEFLRRMAGSAELASRGPGL
jgi:TRAP-type transport system small permease protein